MNNSQIADLIARECKRKNIKIGEILQACNINHSFLYDIKNKNRAPSVDKLSAIADYLGVSVDYLLGRTDKLNDYNRIVNNGNTTISDNGIQANIVNNHLDEYEKGLLNVFKKLSFEDKMSVINHAINLEKSYHQPKPIKYVARDLTGNNNHGNIYISNDDIKKAETDDYSKYD